MTHDPRRVVADPQALFPTLKIQGRRSEARRKSVYGDFVDNIA